MQLRKIGAAAIDMIEDLQVGGHKPGHEVFPGRTAHPYNTEILVMLTALRISAPSPGIERIHVRRCMPAEDRIVAKYLLRAVALGGRRAKNG